MVGKTIAKGIAYDRPSRQDKVGCQIDAFMYRFNDIFIPPFYNVVMEFLQLYLPHFAFGGGVCHIIDNVMKVWVKKEYYFDGGLANICFHVIRFRLYDEVKVMLTTTNILERKMKNESRRISFENVVLTDDDDCLRLKRSSSSRRARSFHLNDVDAHGGLKKWLD
ncbi:hypothetical protein DICVIV_02200 [Dictyocaulus viviparus]|uniref:Uncharacterized protein n=1 Tax=Dictyocaulus viviparus TaxID=29172 RepID=A0A0D8Y6Q1_DICVI|nr:hypothetical protein DICVIV_02200 [Dictyocaulus viviparus]